jgi:glutamate-1-semialdehyde 2,1-aminomutase
MKITLDSSMERFMEKFKTSREFTEKCRDRIPGAYSRVSFNYGPHAIYVDYGEGQYIHTIDGHRLLDLNNNFTVNVLGHNHPKITSALTEAIPKGFSFGNPMKYESQLAEIICDRVNSVEKIKFSCSASESCVSAVRIARANTGKNKIAKFEGGYHGFIDDLQISAHPSPERFPGPAKHPAPLADSAGIPSYTIENTIILPQNDIDACENILRENAHDTACVIMELQSGAGGVVVLDKEFVQSIRDLTEELGILMIVDETITLRGNYHGLQGAYGVTPDLTVMGKIIGGGLPLGAVGGLKDYFHVTENGQVHLSGTHQGHPLAAVAGIACLEVMDEAAYDRLNELAERIKKEINEWTLEKGYPFIVYGAFSFLGYAFTDEPGRELKSHRDFWNFTNEDHIFTFALEMANRDFFPVHRGQIALSLPMTNDDIDGFLHTTKEIVAGILVD